MSTYGLVPGDYVRVTNERDVHFEHVAEVVGFQPSSDWGVEPSVILLMHPFGGGLKKERVVEANHVTKLNPLETLAEASRWPLPKSAG